MKKLSKILLACSLALGTGAFALNGLFKKDEGIQVAYAEVSLDLKDVHYTDDYGEHTFATAMPTGFSFSDNTLTISSGAAIVYEIC